MKESIDKFLELWDKNKNGVLLPRKLIHIFTPPTLNKRKKYPLEFKMNEVNFIVKELNFDIDTNFQFQAKELLLKIYNDKELRIKLNVYTKPVLMKLMETGNITLRKYLFIIKKIESYETQV